MVGTRKYGAVCAAIGLLLATTPGWAVLGQQTAQAPSGEAFGTWAATPLGSQAKSPVAVVTPGELDRDEALEVSVPGVVLVESLFSMASAAAVAGDASAETSTTVARVDILDGLITADGVVAISSSAIRGTLVNSNAEGSEFAGLEVAGMPMSALPAPNTRVALPGVGEVILNEQVRHGDGVNSTGLTVNMIHVITRNALTGATTGEIIVGAASSRVVR